LGGEKTGLEEFKKKRVGTEGVSNKDIFLTNKVSSYWKNDVPIRSEKDRGN